MREEEGPDLINSPFDSGFLARLQKLQICAKRIFSGRFAALHVSRKLGTGHDFADHRAYSPGDDLRLLDWNVYARSEKLYTKLYHQHCQGLILLDTTPAHCHQSSFSGHW